MDISFPIWTATLALIAGLLALDLLVLGRRRRAVRVSEAAVWSVFYIAVAVAFGLVLGLTAGWDLGAQYFAGYIVEKSLSVDNLFVFVIIFSAFAVPVEQQPKALTIGIIIALALRSVFIALGAALLATFSFMLLVFGLALIATAVQLHRHRAEHPAVENNALVAAVRRVLPIATRYDGAKITTQAGGRRVFTPMILVLVAIGSTDLLFAFDSIPAVFGVTKHAFIVFAANAFALLGLRALYFLLAGLLGRLIYLRKGLAVILAFIGAKLMLEFAHHQNDAIPEISTGLSLAVIAGVLAVTVLASLRTTGRGGDRGSSVSVHAAGERERAEEDQPDQPRAQKRGQGTGVVEASPAQPQRHEEHERDLVRAGDDVEQPQFLALPALRTDGEATRA
jgi:tellurite resistance protein TerC